MGRGVEVRGNSEGEAYQRHKGGYRMHDKDGGE
jgi:hypothetical protein